MGFYAEMIQSPLNSMGLMNKPLTDGAKSLMGAGQSGPGGALSGALGVNNQFQAQSANLQTPMDSNQAMGTFSGAGNAVGKQMELAGQLAGQNGIGNQSNVFSQQQVLAGQLGQQAMGQGPNPALAQLANTTGQNVAQQSAMMGSMRGTGANPGLIARQAAQQGAGIQQNAAGQAAVLRAQQQLAAQQQLQQQQQMMAGLAGQQVGQQQNAYNSVTQGAQNNAGMAFGQLNSQNNALSGLQQNLNNVNAGVANQNAGISGNLMGGLMNSAGSLLGSGMFGGGGNSTPTSVGSGSQLGNMVGMGGSAMGAMIGMADGGQVPGMSPQIGAQGPQSMFGRYINSPQIPMFASRGTSVPGQAKTAGDSPRNDTVPAMLSPGEIVVPRSMAMDPDKAAAFAYQISMRSRK